LEADPDASSILVAVEGMKGNNEHFGGQIVVIHGRIRPTTQ